MTEKLIASLFGLLEDEYQNYCKLKELALAKKDVLISNDVEGLTRLLEKDNEIVDNLEKLEKKRTDLVSQLARSYELDADKINFSRLIKVIPGKWQDSLETLKEKLLQTIEELHEQNEQNKVLVEEAVKLNNFSINMIMKAIEPDNQTYDPKQGNRTRGKMAHIIDRRG